MAFELRKILNFRGMIFLGRIHSILAKHPIRHQLESASTNTIAHVSDLDHMNDYANGQQRICVLGPLSIEAA